jgi:hypothetical protein
MASMDGVWHVGALLKFHYARGACMQRAGRRVYVREHGNGYVWELVEGRRVKVRSIRPLPMPEALAQAERALGR